MKRGSHRRRVGSTSRGLGMGTGRRGNEGAGEKTGGAEAKAGKETTETAVA